MKNSLQRIRFYTAVVALKKRAQGYLNIVSRKVRNDEPASSSQTPHKYHLENSGSRLTEDEVVFINKQLEQGNEKLRRLFGLKNRNAEPVTNMNIKVSLDTARALAVSYTHLTLPTNREV